ncbi:hypothetical protein AB0O47_39560 [Streptomyces noursei]|uniref:hypothetical protein n=1 Tax=Streptomyces noursei TaxID=1971 RepID=UPI00344CEFD7
MTYQPLAAPVTPTERVIQWVTRYRILGGSLSDLPHGDHEHDLARVVADLLHPSRGQLDAEVLHAAGVHTATANALWLELSGDRLDNWTWIDGVDWPAVRRALPPSPFTEHFDDALADWSPHPQ